MASDATIGHTNSNFPVQTTFESQVGHQKRLRTAWRKGDNVKKT